MKKSIKAWIGTVAAVAAAAMLIPASAAYAGPVILPTETQGSLTVHKYQTPDPQNDNSNDGSENAGDLSGLTPIDGVTFQVQQVTGIDLATNEGWAQTSTLAGVLDPTTIDTDTTSVSDGTNTYALGTKTTGVTANGGVYEFANLPIGLYLVQEIATPAGVVPSAPFLVTIPITANGDANGTSNDTEPDGTTWLYDVNVYPKNSVDSVHKTVSDSYVEQVGDVATWTVNGTIGIPDGAVLNGYALSDTLDPRLVYQGDLTLTITDPVTGAAVISAPTLVQDVDYTVIVPSEDPTDAVEGVNPALPANTLFVSLTAAGLEKIADYNMRNLTMAFKTTANDHGQIPNTAALYPDGPGVDSSWESIPSETVYQKYGDMVINKTSAVDGSALAGAQFKVYAYTPTDASDTTCSNADVDVSTATPITIDPIGDGSTTSTVDGTVWTTDSTGTAHVDGLRASDWVNGGLVSVGDPYYLQYCLVEVSAPQGFSLLANPIPFTVDSTDVTDTVVDKAVNVADAPVNGGFTLPFTGSTGTTLIFTFGGILVAALIVVVIVARKRASSREKNSTTTTL